MDVIDNVYSGNGHIVGSLAISAWAKYFYVSRSYKQPNLHKLGVILKS